MLTFNALAGSGKGGDLFICSVSEVSDLYQTFITPAGKISGWQLIYKFKQNPRVLGKSYAKKKAWWP